MVDVDVFIVSIVFFSCVVVYVGVYSGWFDFYSVDGW